MSLREAQDVLKLHPVPNPFDSNLVPVRVRDVYKISINMSLQDYARLEKQAKAENKTPLDLIDRMWGAVLGKLKELHPNV